MLDVRPCPPSAPALLRQPGCFEGRFRLTVVLELGDQSAPELHHDRQSLLLLDPTPPPDHTGRSQRKYLVAEIANVREVNLEDLVGLEDVRVKRPQALVSLVSSLQHSDL